MTYWNEHPNMFSINIFFFKQNSDPFYGVTDDVTKLVDVCHRKPCELLGINFV